jgi:hypothetical protein
MMTEQRDAGTEEQGQNSTHRREREVIKHVRAVLPRVRIAILLHALFVETVDLRYLTRFMIAPQ